MRPAHRLLAAFLAASVCLAGPARAEARGSDEVLLQAAQEGMVALLEERLGAGAPIDSRDPKGRTPLMLAVRRNHAEAAALLLARGADPEATDCQGHTAATWAVRLRHVTLLHAILARLRGKPAYARQVRLAAAAAAEVGDHALEQTIRSQYADAAPPPGAPTPAVSATPPMWPRPTRPPRASEAGAGRVVAPPGGEP
ncbi:MAG: ankyrin repeat domain-containing protein [Candidatus Sericytochromatia bacterium]|nr:ankyrin repeat domain-containing protein [Candidatus Sericytochromatia bacterium]